MGYATTLARPERLDNPYMRLRYKSKPLFSGWLLMAKFTQLKVCVPHRKYAGPTCVSNSRNIFVGDARSDDDVIASGLMA